MATTSIPERLPGCSRWILLLAACVVFALPANAAQTFGDIRVSPQPSHDGTTHHGYREFRVLLENSSSRRAHRVTVSLPDYSYGWGNGLRRIRRTTSLEPGALAEISLWQPALPMVSSGGMEVIVDGESLGTANVPNAQRHINPGAPRGTQGSTATFLVGRGLDHDAVNRTLHGGSGLALSAAKAIGAPDATLHSGIHPNAWMPDLSIPVHGRHWIELDYAKPVSAGTVEIYETTGALPVSGATLVFKGSSGTNLASVAIPPSTPISHGAPTTVSIPSLAEPFQTLRIEFPPGPAICIDAVGVSEHGSTFSWAVAARASSESSAMASAYVGSHLQDQRQFLRAELPVTEWSSHWLSYTPYDAVVLGRTDQSLMTGPVLAALRGYVMAGGTVILLGDPGARERWPAHRSLPHVDDGQSADIGFGQCFIFATEKPDDLSPAAVQAILAASEASARFWQLLPFDEAANNLFPVVDNVAIPARSLVLVMLGFVLLIGPTNLIVLSRLKRRVWMLWTIPIISFLTCGVVFAYSYIREGFTPDCRTETLTCLDQPNRLAASIGAAAFYFPLTPSDGLRFSTVTEATPLIQTGYHQYGTQREIDWTQEQHLNRGWVTARVPAHFYLRKSEPRRERLQVGRTADGGSLEVLNGLGTEILSLWLCDASGHFHQAAHIAAGQRSPLAPMSQLPPTAEKLQLRSLFLQAGLAGQSTALSTNASAYLTPGTYIAELDQNPFLENGFKERSLRTKTRAFIYGILDEPDLP